MDSRGTKSDEPIVRGLKAFQDAIKVENVRIRDGHGDL